MLFKACVSLWIFHLGDLFSDVSGVCDITFYIHNINYGLELFIFYSSDAKIQHVLRHY